MWFLGNNLYKTVILPSNRVCPTSIETPSRGDYVPLAYQWSTAFPVVPLVIWNVLFKYYYITKTFKKKIKLRLLQLCIWYCQRINEMVTLFTNLLPKVKEYIQIWPNSTFIRQVMRRPINFTFNGNKGKKSKTRLVLKCFSIKKRL